MEEYKEKVLEMLRKNSLSEKEISAWKQFLNCGRFEQMVVGERDYIIQKLLILTPDDIRFFTDYFVEVMEAIKTNDAERKRKADQKELQHLLGTLLMNKTTYSA